MKLVLSRKGFDSSWGGSPSPIFPDGRMISLPIPQQRSGVTYGNLQLNGGLSYLDVMRQLGIRRLRRRSKSLALDEQTEVHLDPDLVCDVRPRPEGWRAVYGQVNAALSHLRAESVGAGDIFLFFGWFRSTISTATGYRYAGPGDGFHAVFGYLEVGEVLNVDAATDIPWAAEHPHLQCRETKEWRENCLFIAARRCSLVPSLPGAGTVAWHEALRLSEPGRSRSFWRLPRAFHPRFTKMPLTYHAKRSWDLRQDHVQLHTAPIGQEFVVEINDGIKHWLVELLTRPEGRPT
jgi:Nucleotide modification associated domain 3